MLNYLKSKQYKIDLINVINKDKSREQLLHALDKENLLLEICDLEYDIERLLYHFKQYIDF